MLDLGQAREFLPPLRLQGEAGHGERESNVKLLVLHFFFSRLTSATPPTLRQYSVAAEIDRVKSRQDGSS